MSVSGISSDTNSYLLYLLQLQQSQNPTSTTVSSGTQDALASSQSLTFDLGTGEEAGDGTYASSQMGSGNQPSSNNFLSDLQSLLQATQSGNMAAAQTAAGAVESDLGLSSSNVSQSLSTSNTNAASGTSSGAQSFLGDLSSLLTAVQSGDMTTAQGAANALEQDLQAMSPPPSSSAASANSTSASSSGATTASPSTNPLTNFVNDLSSLLQATSSGDTTAAQSAATKVQADLQSLTQSSSNSTAASASNTGSAASPAQTSGTASSDTLANQIAQALLAAFSNPSATPARS
jgi:hypothetical protein